MSRTMRHEDHRPGSTMVTGSKYDTAPRHNAPLATQPLLSSLVNRLQRAEARIARLFTPITIGTSDAPHTLKAVDLAYARVEAWARVHVQDTTLGERGGTFTPNEVDENDETRRIAAQALKDVQRIPELCSRINHDTAELEQIVQRVTVSIDPKKMPAHVIPGCRSCARREDDGEIEIGGHWAALYDKAKSVGLCRWCYDASAGGKGTLPPVRACHLYHVEGPTAAGRWLARQGGAPRT